MRYFLCRVTGTGTREDPYRPALPDGTVFAASIPTDPAGVPVRGWCLVAVEATDYATIDASVDVQALPVNIDAAWSTIPSQTRTRIADAVTQRLGLAVTAGQGEMVPTRAIRFLIRQIGRHLDGPAFHEDRLRVG